MKVYQAQIRGTLPGHFRAGEWARVVDAVFVIPSPHERDQKPPPRLCWYVAFPDGTTDYWPVGEPYEIKPALWYEGRA